jgi:hypothetical protein
MSCDNDRCGIDRCDHDRFGFDNPFLKGLGFGLGFGLGSGFLGGGRFGRGFDNIGCFDECRSFRDFDFPRFFRGCGPCGFRRWFW